MLENKQDPNHDITTIRISGRVIKIKNDFLRENDNCEVFLFRDKVLIKVTITSGEISEYESFPGRMDEQNAKRSTSPARTLENGDAATIAWLYSNNQNIALYHKRVWEGGSC